jgi:flagellar FliL protein
VPIVAAVLVVVGIGLGAAWYFKLISIGGQAAAEAAPVEHGTIMYDMGERVVNLSDAPGFHYLKVRMTLEFNDAAHRPGELKGDPLVVAQNALGVDLQPFSPKVEDFLITTLTRQTAADLLTPRGKESVRVELLAGLRERIPQPALKALYFTEFIIQ